MKKIYITSILLLIFSVTLLFRVQFISNKSHCLDDNHIYMLTTLSVWDKEGAFNHKFSPVITFTNPGDKYVSLYKRLEDKKGNNYYVSYPPFLFIITYPILQTFGFENGRVVLQIINLLLHLISCFFIYLTVLLYFRKKYCEFFLPAIMAFAVYCFSPVVLYLHTDIYFPEMFSQVLLIVSIYFTLKLLQILENAKKIYFLLYGVLIFCFVYTEWIGGFFAFSICLILFNNRKKPGYVKLIKIVSSAAFLSVVLTLFQYSQINGFKSMLRSFLIRFIDRSGYFTGRFSESVDNIYNLDSYLIYAKNIFNGLWGVGLVFFLLIIALLIVRKGKINFRNLFKNNLLILSALPVLIYFLIFFNGTMLHYHLVAKIMVPVSLLTGLILGKFRVFSDRIKMIPLVLTCVAFLVISVFSLLRYSNYENFLIANTNQNKALSSAAYITSIAKTEDVIFLNIETSNPEPILYLSFLTKRNMVYSKSTEIAGEKLQLLPHKSAIYFVIDEDSARFNFVRIEK
jgi:hypothetical protein